MDEKVFISGAGERVTYTEMVSYIANYLMKDPSADYEIGVGTDSQNHAKTRMTEVISVRRVGHGGIFFYRSEMLPKILRLKDKIYEETSRSLENANGLVDAIELILMEHDIDINDMNVSFEIHCDIGYRGKTRALIEEIVGWVHSLDYEVKIKPESYIASGIANKFSK